MKTYNFSVIGGDFRAITAANKLSLFGHNVTVFGFDDPSPFNNKIAFSHTLDEAIKDSKYILLPLPCCVSSGKIFTPLFKDTIITDDILAQLNETHIVLAGKLDNLFAAKLENKNISFYDYFKCEDFSVKNAVPTAEGAVEIALREMPITLNSSRCLITGFGRISKLLSSLIKNFGSHVTVSARRHSDIAWITAKGYEALYISDLPDNIHKYDVIFNTVPYPILNTELLKKISKDCLIIDLASKPGGVDFESAQALGLNVIWALSLPGKVAPLTAGEIITETILNIIKESEVN